MVYGIAHFRAFLTTDSGCRSKSPSLSPIRDSTPDVAVPKAREKGGSGAQKGKGNLNINQAQISAHHAFIRWIWYTE